jgi:WXG100 family type VII secretion target
MDFSIKYEDVDGAIRQYNSGIQRLNDLVKTLKNDISNFNGGGFQGQSGDKMEDLLNRKIGHLNQLISTYERAIQMLEQAKQKAQDADEELHKRVSAI